MYECIHNSVLWEDAAQELSEMPIKQKIELYSRTLYPTREHPLTLEDKLDILMKIPAAKDIIDSMITERQREVINLLDEGMKYDDICIELGFANKSSIVQTILAVRKKIEREL